MFQVTLTGTLGRDAEEKEFGGKRFITFSVAVNERKKNEAGEYVESTTWIDVIHNNNGGTLINYLKKGTRVLIQGAPRVNVYMNKDNAPVGSLSVRAFTLELLGGKHEEQEFTKSPSNAAPSQGRATSSDELPF